MTVLGPVRAHVGGSPVDLPGARVRLLLARLALARGRAVPSDVLIDDLWGADPLADASNALQALVSRLRKAVGGEAVEFASGGYRLGADLDVPRFEELAARGRRQLAGDRPAVALADLDAALRLWTGAALGDLPDVAFVRAAAARLEELRLGAAEDRFDAMLRLGRHGEALADLETWARAHPLRERLAGLRMRALHAAGRQAAALGAYEEIRGALADQLGVDPGDDLRQVHLAMLRGELDRPAARPRLVPGRLPAQLTGFIGRDAELTLVAELVEAARLVTIVGPGGVGKTRLAVEAAARHPVHGRGRMWFVPLAGVGVPAAGEVSAAVLGVLGAAQVRLDGERRGDLDRLVELIGPEPAVLVLDNCEHLVDAAAGFADRLLTRLPRLTILATSREPLAITGEALCRLGPLELPAEAGDASDAGDSAAVRLFVDRARAVQPGFGLDEATAGPVVEICRRLDGLPLALELAAARLRSMTAEQIAHHLDDRFRLLASGSRAALPRHRTLRAAVEWSWDLLTEQERLLAERLSVFPGGATAAALEAVCADGTPRAGDVVYVLGSLVEKSLVQWDGQRYRMLETIRAYASERPGDGRAPVAERFVRHFLTMAEEHEARVRTREQLPSLRWFDAEYDNLVAALRTAIGDRDTDAAARLAGSLLWYWQTLRMDARADGFVGEVLAFGDAVPGHHRAAFVALYRMPGKDGQAADPEKVRSVIEDCIATGALERHPMLLIMTAPMAYFIGDRELAERLLRAAEAGTDGWAAFAAWFRAVFRNDHGDWAGAAAERRRALDLSEAAGDRFGLTFTLAGVAQDHAVQGRHEEAIAALERCTLLASEIGWDEAISYRARLGVQRLRTGDLDGARRDLEAALRHGAERGHPHLRIEALAGLAELHRRAGEPDRAERTLGRLEALVRGMPAAEQTAAVHIAPVRAAIMIDTGDLAAARELLPWVAATGAALSYMAAPGAELLARLLAREGDAAGAATALGMSQAVRGAFHRGDAELRELVDDLTARLGATAYAEAFDRGARMSRADALDRLCPA